MQIQEQQNEIQYHTSKLIFDEQTSLSNGLNIQQVNIVFILLNSFGLDYQNNSLAYGIWTSNILAIMLKYYIDIRDFIIKDEEKSCITMFESEFILKVFQ